MNTPDPTQEITFAIIKPDVALRPAQIFLRQEERGLLTVAMQMMTMTPSSVRALYSEHVDKPWFAAHSEFMASGPCIRQILQGVNAVAVWRDLMGATNPADAADGTIRQMFGTDLPHNAVHGSLTHLEVADEMALFFVHHRRKYAKQLVAQREYAVERTVR